MKIRYSSEVDILYIRYNNNKIVDSDEVSDGIIEDYDANGNIVGREILDASKNVIGQKILNSFFANIKDMRKSPWIKSHFRLSARRSVPSFSKKKRFSNIHPRFSLRIPGLTSKKS